MTNSVNQAARAGSFLSGKPNWVSIATLVDVAQTNVTTPLTDLPGYNTWATLGVWSNVTVVDGSGLAVTYDNLDDYSVAFYQQVNLNALVTKFSERANVAQVSVKVLPSSIMGVNVNAHSAPYFADSGFNSVMGSAYNGTGYKITLVDIATEHAYGWDNTGDESNDNGYTLIGAFNGLKAYDYDNLLDDSNVNGTDYTYDPYYTSMGGTQWDYICTGAFRTATSECNTVFATSYSLPASDIA